MERHGQGPPAPVPADPSSVLRARPATTDVLVVFASRHGATRGVAERIAARLHEGGLAVTLSQVEDVGGIPPGCAVVLGRNIAHVREAMRPLEYRVFAGVIRREQWPLASRMLFHLFGGRLGDNRDWADIDEWAQTILESLRSLRP
jgi:hypothetical protein